MHHLKFKFTGFLKVFTQYALILRRSVYTWKGGDRIATVRYHDLFIF
jgi:hypothetical protein